MSEILEPATNRFTSARICSLFASVALAAATLLPAAPTPSRAQQPAPAPTAAPAPAAEKPLPGLDLSSIDMSVDPCTDMYKFACGKFEANHPIPADQPGVDPFYVLYNVNTQQLNDILKKAEAGGSSRTPDEQKIGDYFKACMNTDAIDAAGLKSIQPLLDDINAIGPSPAGKAQFAILLGKLQRDEVDVFFGYGEQQDFKDASKQIAEIGQGGLGLPEKDYYLRTGEKDAKLRAEYVAHITKMLTLAGSTPEQAKKDADNIMAMETALAKASLGVVDLREPEKTYHLQPIATLEASLPGFNFNAYEDGIHSPHVTEINNSTPQFWSELMHQFNTADLETIKAYLRYHLLTTVAGNLPHQFDAENFDFYGRILEGQPEQQARWKRCSNAVNGAIGEALGKVYVDQYFAGDSKARMVEMVKDIETAMGADIDAIDWMSPSTKVRAKEKLAGLANKIGYPDKWRDYSKLEIKPDDPVGNKLRANGFENDRQLNKIGKPVDRKEWDMTPPTVNAYYNPSMNDINFPAGILQPPFYDRTQDDAVNYGHIGAVIGHELTHGFDDEGRKFDAKGNLSDWWTPEDLKKFDTRTDCLVNEYGAFTAVDDVKVNGKLTLGENTADNGGLLLAFMAYMKRAQEAHLDINAKRDGFTGPQRFYIAFAQNYCENSRPESIRSQVLTDPHSPDHFRVDGVIVNQPAFANAFGCKKAAPMVPANSCRVW
jgi:endothelin-converting enzyme/putative endopeptidase